MASRRPSKSKKTPPPGKKILRIGVIQNGTIIEERLLRKRQTVTIGTGFKNTFCVSAPKVPHSFNLFEVKGGQYYLNFQKDMTGRISVGQGVHSLKSLKEHGKAVNRGKYHSVSLAERSRGKVVVGDVVFLYQFVTPPPPKPAPQLPVALRGGMLTFLNNTVELSGIYGFAMLLSLVVQVGFVGYLVLEVPPPPRATGVSDLPDQIQMILMDREEQELIETAEMTEDEMAALAESAVEEEEPEAEEVIEELEPDNRESEVSERVEDPEPDREEQLRAARETVREEAFWSAMTTSDSGLGDPMAQVLNISDRSVEHVMRRQQARSDSGVAGTSVLGRDEQSTGNTVDVNVGRSSGADRADRVEADEERERVRVQARIRSRPPQVVGSGSMDADYLNSELRRRTREIERCYQRMLNDQPDLEGRIVLQFEINGRGRVENAQLRENDVGDAVGDCILGRVRRWRFDEPDNGSVTVRKTYILTPAG
jgi:hypothetical protein